MATLYIIKVFSDSFSLGIFTAFFYFVSFVFGMLFAKKLKTKSQPKFIFWVTILTVFSLVLMMIVPMPVTIIFFQFCKTIYYDVMSLNNGTCYYNFSNQKQIASNYKVEYFLAIELALMIGRAGSMIIFAAAYFVDILFLLPIFIPILIIYPFLSTKLLRLSLTNFTKP